MTGNEEVLRDKMSYFPAQPLSRREVEAEMLSSEDTAQSRFFGVGRKASERAFDSGENFRGYVELETVPLEKGDQHLRPGSAQDRMSPGIGWVGGGLADLREPIRIGHRLGVVVAFGSPDSGHGPPEIVSVFGVVEGN